MSEHENMQAPIKLRRSRRTQKQNGAQPPPLPLPTNDDKEGWEVYWKAQGQPWRWEPEIDSERQKYLAERRSIMPDIKQGIYPFKDIRLNRADVEWLLATHEKGRGPDNWGDESQRERDGLDLRGADVSQEDLRGLPLARMYGALATSEWENATEEQRNMAVVCMKGADLRKAQLQGADLRGAQLQGAHLRWAQLQGADLRRVQLDGVYLKEATLSDEQYGPALLADVRWGEINLAVVDWMPVKMLGDERRAHQTKKVDDYQTAVRANRQLGVVLRDQGLNEVADRFAYRAQVLQRKVSWKQKKIGQYLFSLFLALLAGYGYKPWRTFLAYLLVITAFATAYFALGQTIGPALSPLGSFVFSMTSFHGRGFFLGGIALDDPLTALAALEAFVGLLIEVTFIATLTQRLFSK
jgi:hypothetical protein